MPTPFSFPRPFFLLSPHKERTKEKVSVRQSLQPPALWFWKNAFQGFRQFFHHCLWARQGFPFTPRGGRRPPKIPNEANEAKEAISYIHTQKKSGPCDRSVGQGPVIEGRFASTEVVFPAFGENSAK